MTVRNKIAIGLACLALAAAFFAYRAYNYAKQPDYKTFKSNITFQYPKSWTVKSGCDFTGAFIGTRTIVQGDFKASKDAKLVLHGRIADRGECVKGNRGVKISNKCHSSEEQKQKDDPHVYLSTLNNTGLTGAPVDPARVTHVRIMDGCDVSLFSFDFVKNNGEEIESSDDLLRYQEPGVNKDKFIKSEAYKEIVKFAESIKIEK